MSSINNRSPFSEESKSSFSSLTPPGLTSSDQAYSEQDQKLKRIREDRLGEGLPENEKPVKKLKVAPVDDDLFENERPVKLLKRNREDPVENEKPVKKLKGVLEAPLQNEEQIENPEDILKNHFEKRKLENFGNLAILPEEVRDKIITSIPIKSHPETLRDKIITNTPNKSYEDIRKALNIMKNFWKAQLGEKAVFRNIDAKKFAKWIGENQIPIRALYLSTEDFNSLVPYSEYLDLSKMHRFDFQLLKDCKNLKSLIFPNNVSPRFNITDEEIALLTQLTNLKHLDLTRCKITEKGIKYIAQLTHLEFLNVSYHPVYDDEIKYIAQLTNLKHLDLTESQIKDEGINNLAKLSNLKSLNLTRCDDITDKEIEYLAQLTHLQHLDFSGCRNITYDGVANISKNNPKICIFQRY